MNIVEKMRANPIKTTCATLFLGLSTLHLLFGSNEWAAIAFLFFLQVSHEIESH